MSFSKKFLVCFLFSIFPLTSFSQNSNETNNQNKITEDFYEFKDDLGAYILSRCGKLYQNFKSTKKTDGLIINIKNNNQSAQNFFAPLLTNDDAYYTTRNASIDNVYIESLPSDAIPGYLKNELSSELNGSVLRGCHVGDASEQSSFNIYFYTKMGLNKQIESIEFVGPIRN